VLANYAKDTKGLDLDVYLNRYVFADCKSKTEMPDANDTAGFAEYMKLYKKGLTVEKTAGLTI